MGEGIKRLLALSLNLVSSAGGYLLVDEIDTGLHFGTALATEVLGHDSPETLRFVAVLHLTIRLPRLSACAVTLSD